VRNDRLENTLRLWASCGLANVVTTRYQLLLARTVGVDPPRFSQAANESKKDSRLLGSCD
jgi:hypothetical protein